ncbi:MAG TPA: GNAT family N-acetyltransferase [Longimicrobium sp.]|nr:GNAT family N-acetyltransferase [Longimicrobium sp.]
MQTPERPAPTIRPARDADVPAIAALATHMGYPTNEADMRARLERIGALPGYATLVAEIDGRVVSFAGMMLGWSYVNDRAYARLLSLSVEPAEQGRGTGAARMAAVEAWARERGAGSVHLTTALRRDGAHRFYERIGYAHTGRRYLKKLAE